MLIVRLIRQRSARLHASTMTYDRRMILHARNGDPSRYLLEPSAQLIHRGLACTVAPEGGPGPTSRNAVIKRPLFSTCDKGVPRAAIAVRLHTRYRRVDSVGTTKGEENGKSFLSVSRGTQILLLPGTRMTYNFLLCIRDTCFV